mmetsp:Transcript_171464/g.416992  ORF Transcript_171464/g.416992 Transcript_171464/m.416992 type:complete len:240 (+) Transcript_171464:1217-1936(+)
MALERQPVVHQAKDTLFIFTAVPCAKDHGNLLLNIERDGDLAVQAVALPVLVDLGTRVDYCKIGLEADKLLSRLGADEHVRHKVLLPRELVHETHFFLRRRVGPAVPVKDVALVERVKAGDGLGQQILKHLRRGGLVHAAPPHVPIRLGPFVLDHPLVPGGAPRELARVDRERVAILGLDHHALAVALLVLEKLGIRKVVVDRRRVVNAQRRDAHRVARGGEGAALGQGGAADEAEREH